MLSKEKATIEDIDRLKAQIKHPGSLCNFAGKCEKETMVGQTIHACATNYKKHGECFSVHAIKGNMADNAQSYSELVTDGLFIQEDRDGQTVIFPTKKLILKLDAFFAE